MRALKHCSLLHLTHLNASWQYLATDFARFQIGPLKLRLQIELSRLKCPLVIGIFSFVAPNWPPHRATPPACNYLAGQFGPSGSALVFMTCSQIIHPFAKPKKQSKRAQLPFTRPAALLYILTARIRLIIVVELAKFDAPRVSSDHKENKKFTSVRLQPIESNCHEPDVRMQTNWSSGTRGQT